jgi:hypothetical protein
MARSDPQMVIRVPLDLKAFVKAQAARNGSSQNSEVVRALRERMDRERAQVAARPAAE